MIKNDDYDKIYQTSIEVVKKRFPKNLKDIPLKKLDEIVQGTIDLFQLKNFNFKDTLIKELREAISVRSSSGHAVNSPH